MNDLGQRLALARRRVALATPGQARFAALFSLIQVELIGMGEQAPLRVQAPAYLNDKAPISRSIKHSLGRTGCQCQTEDTPSG